LRATLSWLRPIRSSSLTLASLGARKGLVTTARWLTTKDAQELRQKQKAKEDAIIAKKRAAINKKAEIEARKVQKAADCTVRLVEQQTIKEFKDEYLRLAKIHKTYYK
jgi:hypothetical protein